MRLRRQDNRFVTGSPTTGLARAVNGLGRRFVPAVDGPFIASGAGLWVLLAALLAGARGQTADELEAATGIDRANAARLASEMTAWLQAYPGTSLAAGLWSATPEMLRPEYAAALDRFTTGPIPSKADLDRWAAAMTNGAIEGFPMEPDPDAILLLASAILAEGDWLQPFTDRGDGTLTRSSILDDDVGIVAVDGVRFSRAIVRSRPQVDVHLVAGPADAPSAAVLAAGFAAVDGAAAILPGSALRAGDAAGCLTVERVEGPATDDRSWLEVPRFELRSEHDLLRQAEVLGLTLASTPAADLSGMSDYQPYVSQAIQEAMIEFESKGFRAAAITALAMRAGAALPPREQNTTLLAKTVLDRPFACFVVERASNMVLFHGWVDPAG